MSFKKYDGSTWQPITPKKLKGVPYTGTLPAVLTDTKAGYLHRYKIYGSTEQTGTPTPENPIMPQECGEKTENLFDKGTATYGHYITSSGAIGDSEKWVCSDYISVTPNHQYSFMKEHTHISVVSAFNAYYDINKNYISSFAAVNTDTTITTPQNAAYVRLSIKISMSPLDNYMFVDGSSVPQFYIPYGYKLPLTSAGQDVDIYLGESQTTRRIKKLVLDGTETSWNDVGGNAPYRIWLPDIVSTSDKNSVLFLSTHYRAVPNNASWVRYNACVSWSFIGITNGKWLQFRDTNQASLADFKTYLAQQYANGTPVTVWYVLATEETGTLNEPLRKIGDYADTIDSTQTNAQIPTSAGSTTISWAGEGLAPSEFDSVQEWVDIPTYTYANGAWVEDNDNKVIYGIRIDPDVADPYTRVTYLEDAVGMTPAAMGATAFDYGSWAGAFFMPKPCVLSFDGTVAYYLDPNDYGKKIDGTPSNISDLSIGGNVMLEFPKIWFKYVPNESGKDGDFYVANYKVDEDYECWCNYDADNNEIDHFYMAAYNGCCYDGKMRSISGLALAPYVTTAYSASSTYAVGDKVNYRSKMYECITAVEAAEAFDPAKWQQFAFNGNATGTEEMAYARANNTAAKDEWLIDLWADAILIWGLLMLMGKTTALQDTFGRGIDSGLQEAAEAYETGSLNDKGLFYGDTVNGSTAVKVFGIENFWACKWRRCAGFFGTSTGYAYKLTHGTKDGSTVSSFGTSEAGYLAVTTVRPTSNYVKNMMLGRHGLIAGVTGSPASASTYYCDYFYRGAGCALFGGYSGDGRNCGLYARLDNRVSARSWNIAAALSCKPLA